MQSSISLRPQYNKKQSQCYKGDDRSARKMWFYEYDDTFSDMNLHDYTLFLKGHSLEYIYSKKDESYEEQDEMMWFKYEEENAQQRMDYLLESNDENEGEEHDIITYVYSWQL